MQLYLRPMGDPSRFSDASEYEEIPFPAPDGFEWIEGLPNTEAQIYRAKTLGERLNDIFLTQLPNIRAQFYTLKAAIKIALEEGDNEAAQVMIQNTSVSPELQPIKEQMLSLFPQ